MFDAVAEDEPTIIAPIEMPTGLSDELDAQRYLRLTFDSDNLGFCRNCEQTYTGDIYTRCPRCFDPLAEPGTAPRRRKFTPS